MGYAEIKELAEKFERNDYNFIRDDVITEDLLQTKYFRSSWLNPGIILENSVSLLDQKEFFIDKFNKKVNELYEKDKEKDPTCKKVQFIILKNVFTRTIYMSRVDYFLHKVETDFEEFSKNVLCFMDIYIPRSIWLSGYRKITNNSFK